jgi:hypothetical protein
MDKKLSPAIKFIQTTKVENKLFDIYRAFRKELKNAGFKQEQLSDIKDAPMSVWKIHSRLNNEYQEIIKLVTRYGLNHKDISDYIIHKFKEIDSEIPLN